MPDLRPDGLRAEGPWAVLAERRDSEGMQRTTAANTHRMPVVAASIPARLAASYAACRELHRVHGRTYYLATRFLPAWKRPHVHALYGFTRYTDNLVDCHERGRAERLSAWTRRFSAALDGEPTSDPILPAVVHTVEVFGLERADFDAFLRSMAMDLTVRRYDTYRDLLGYMAGSAAAIGSLMLPILGTDDRAAAEEPARQLGLAFQLTNFLRDIREDAGLGRIYLPAQDMAEFGVSTEDLRRGRLTGEVRALIAFEALRAQAHYARAAAGIPLLHPSSQACIRAAYLVYGGILDEIARSGYDVFSRRVNVPARRRLVLAATGLLTRPGSPVTRVPGR
jgi:phytoene synthase